MKIYFALNEHKKKLRNINDYVTFLCCAVRGSYVGNNSARTTFAKLSRALRIYINSVTAFSFNQLVKIRIYIIGVCWMDIGQS